MDEITKQLAKLGKVASSKTFNLVGEVRTEYSEVMFKGEKWIVSRNLEGKFFIVSCNRKIAIVAYQVSEILDAVRCLQNGGRPVQNEMAKMVTEAQMKMGLTRTSGYK